MQTEHVLSGLDLRPMNMKRLRRNGKLLHAVNLAITFGEAFLKSTS